MTSLELRTHRLKALVVGFLKAGGSPEAPIVDKFCITYGVRKEELIASLPPIPETDPMLAKLERVGLI